MPRLHHPLPHLERKMEGVLLSAPIPLLPQTHVGKDFLAHASIFVGFALAFVYALRIHKGM